MAPIGDAILEPTRTLGTREAGMVNVLGLNVLVHVRFTLAAVTALTTLPNSALIPLHFFQDLLFYQVEL